MGMSLWPRWTPSAATAREIAAQTRAEIAIEDDLREFSVGDWEGLTRDEIAARGEGKGDDEDWLAFYDRAPGGEGLAQAWDRAGRLLARLDADGRTELARLLCQNVVGRMHAPRFRRRLAQIEARRRERE